MHTSRLKVFRLAKLLLVITLPSKLYALPLIEEKYIINFNSSYPGNYSVSQTADFGFGSEVNVSLERYLSSATLSFELETPQIINVPNNGTLFWNESFKVTANTGYNLPLVAGGSYDYQGPFSGDIGEAFYSGSDTAALSKDTPIRSSNVSFQFSGIQSGDGLSISNGNVGSVTLKLIYEEGGRKADARFLEATLKNTSRALRTASLFTDPSNIAIQASLLVVGEIQGQLLDLANTNGGNIGSFINLGSQTRDFALGFLPGIGLTPWSVALNATALAADYSSVYYGIIANDPPDPNFRELATPEDISVPLIGDENDPNTIFRTNLVNKSIEALESQDMILTSLERYQAARNNAFINPEESHFIELQADALFDYMASFREKSSEVAELMSELENRLILDGISLSGPTNLEEIRGLLINNPYSVPEIQALYLEYGEDVVNDAISKVLAYNDQDYQNLVASGLDESFNLSSKYGLNNQFSFSKNVELINLSPVPEPKSYAFMLLGFVIILFSIRVKERT